MKKTILWILLDLIFLAIFNTCFFLLGGAENATAAVWISYGFIHFAYIMTIATPILTRKSQKKTVLGIPLLGISVGYFLVEFVVGVVFILIASETITATLLTQVIIAGIYLILLLGKMIANEHTIKNQEKQKEEVSYIKTAASEIQILVDKASEKKANKAIEKAYDLIHSSPTKSVEEVKGLETDILTKISELKAAVKDDETKKIVEICDEITELVEERNRKVQLSD